MIDMGRASFNTSRAFFVVWILFAYIFFDILAEICEKIDECSCRKSNGKVISLRQIDGGSTPAFRCKYSDGTTYITYQSVPIGYGYERHLQIGLKCNESQFPGEVASVLEELQNSVSFFTTTLTSKCACDDGCPLDSSGLSTGSILLIVFIALLIVYVIGGILINKYKFGVESMPEMCPNYQFWAGVPSLIKDGVVFTCGILKSGCSSLCHKCNENNKYYNMP